jgi:hypothetical protein
MARNYLQIFEGEIGFIFWGLGLDAASWRDFVAWADF